jgi:hypothetical protein
MGEALFVLSTLQLMCIGVAEVRVTTVLISA